MEEFAFWAVAISASFCVGMAKGGVPLISAMAVPLMTLVMSPVLAAGLLLPIYILADMLGLYAYRRNFHPRVLKIMMVAMPIGVLIGYLTAAKVPDAAVTLVVGLIGFWFAIVWLLRRNAAARKPKPVRVKPGVFWGVITGFTSFVSHSGGVPYQVYALPLGMQKLTFAGTVTIAFAYINLVKLIPYYALGQLSAENLRVAGVLALPAVCGVLAGVKVAKSLPEKLFFKVVTFALLLLSSRLIWTGAAALLA